MTVSTTRIECDGEVLSIFYSSDNRLSNVTDEAQEEEDKCSYQSCSDASLGPPTEDAVEDDILQLNENLAPTSDIDMVEHAQSSIQGPMSRLDNDMVHRLMWRLSQYSAATAGEIDDLIHADYLVDLKAFADRRVRSGFKKRCVEVYSNARRHDLDECLAILGVEKLSIKEEQTVQWNSLNLKMRRCSQSFKRAIKVMLTSQKSPCKKIFSRPEPEVQRGEIHPVTRYLMDYVLFLVDHSDTLNTLLESDDDEEDIYHNDDGNRLRKQESMSPFAGRLLSWISLLESKLKEKSILYEDGALQSIFLMNNILYVVEEVKGSDLRKFLGDHWVREHYGQIHEYVISYLRASWGQVLSCLEDEGTIGNASTVALKEKLKNFNAKFEEIYRIQTAWSVPDPQLREQLQISITEKLILAYRSFMGTLDGHHESARHAKKYIKYTPDDLEMYLLDFFEGSKKSIRIQKSSKWQGFGAHCLHVCCLGI